MRPCPSPATTSTSRSGRTHAGVAKDYEVSANTWPASAPRSRRWPPERPGLQSRQPMEKAGAAEQGDTWSVTSLRQPLVKAGGRSAPPQQGDVLDETT